MKEEFEQMALRGNEIISGLLYDTIEKFYMSTNEYHQTHGGVNETKQEFVKRVFGGKINTPKTILEKATAEAIKENRWCLQGSKSATKDRLDNMDAQLTEHYQWLSKHNY